MPYIPIIGGPQEGLVGYAEVPDPPPRRRRRPSWLPLLVLLTWAAFVAYAVIRFGGPALDLWLK